MNSTPLSPITITYIYHILLNKVIRLHKINPHSHFVVEKTVFDAHHFLHKQGEYKPLKWLIFFY